MYTTSFNQHHSPSLKLLFWPPSLHGYVYLTIGKNPKLRVANSKRYLNFGTLLRIGYCEPQLIQRQKLRLVMKEEIESKRF